jgi:hypothetical protein
VDYAIGSSIIFLLTIGFENQILILFGAFLGTLPDFILGTYRHLLTYLERYSFIRIPNQFHMSIQRNIPFYPGLIVTAVTSLISILILLSGK